MLQHTATKKEKMCVFPFLHQAPSISAIFDHIGGALFTNKLEFRVRVFHDVIFWKVKHLHVQINILHPTLG